MMPALLRSEFMINNFERAQMLNRSSIMLALLLALAASPSRAYTFYVSSVTGSSSNTCGTFASSPCASITDVLTKSSPGDLIVCVGPTFTEGVLITKSVEIDCTAGPAVFSSGYTGGAQIDINIPVSSNDPLRNVRLRGLSIVGDFLGARIDKGIMIEAAATVFVENSVITRNGKQGIINAGPQTRLFVTDTVVRNTAGAGIVSAGSSAVTVLDNVRLENNGYGLATAAGNQVTISRSLITANSIAGVEADGGSLVVIDGSTISNNNVGIASGSAVRLSNNNIVFNTTAVSGATGTFGNNRFSGNGSDGTALTPVPGGSTDLGQK